MYFVKKFRYKQVKMHYWLCLLNNDVPFNSHIKLEVFAFVFCLKFWNFFGMMSISCSWALIRRNYIFIFLKLSDKATKTLWKIVKQKILFQFVSIQIGMFLWVTFHITSSIMIKIFHIFFFKMIFLLLQFFSFC